MFENVSDLDTSSEEMEEENEIQEVEEDKNSIFPAILSGAIIAIIIIIILLLKNCGSCTGPIEEPPVGDFTISDATPTPSPTPPAESLEIPMLHFVGNPEYTVSKTNPTITLHNSALNEETNAKFVFTVCDAKTGAVIARTTELNPGENVEINVLTHFEKAGEYELQIVIKASLPDGTPLNGMTQNAKLFVLD